MCIHLHCISKRPSAPCRRPLLMSVRCRRLSCAVNCFLLVACCVLTVVFYVLCADCCFVVVVFMVVGVDVVVLELVLVLVWQCVCQFACLCANVWVWAFVCV